MSRFIQQELRKRGISETTAVEAADWLDHAGVLLDSPSHRGKPVRDLLRAGEIEGADQRTPRPYGRWYIERM